MESTPCVRAYMVEAAFGDREHEIALDVPHHLKVRTNSEIWCKENLINLGVRHLLPRDWKYVAWIDADVVFRDPNWAQETLHQLQHWSVVQPWQNCVDLEYGGGIGNTYTSFGALHQAGVRKQRHSLEEYKYGHSGFAWAARRDFWEQSGGLPDFAILGSGDHHAAWGMVGDIDSTIHRKMHPNFFRLLHEWQDRTVRVTHKQVGFTQGRIEHNFHGLKANRRYRERWQILIDHHFDPVKDLVHDSQGLIQLVGKPDLEQAIRRYNRERKEDSL